MEKNSAEPTPKPVSIILGNRKKLAEKIGRVVHHTPPAAEHYYHLYPWDASSAAIQLAHFGYLREAETEIFSIFNRQRPDGMVPNQQRVEGIRGRDPELLTFTRPWESSDYSQPPIWASAAAAVYDAKKVRDPDSADLFLEEVIPKLVDSFDYFRNNRRIGPGSPLVFNTVPQETGRDSDEALNGYVPKLPQRGPGTPYLIELINTGTDYFGKLALGGLNKLNDWDPQKIKRYYAPLDPMFNSIYAANARVVGRLAGELNQTDIRERFEAEADWVEERIISDLFEPEANQGKGAFLVHNLKGPKDEISISSIGPLLLNLPESILESTLTLMDEHFNTPFPLPTLSTRSQHYDPEGRRLHRVWNGEVMMIANWLGCLGLRKQAARAKTEFDRTDLSARALTWSEKRIIPRSKYLLRNSSYEGYSPETGRPRRTRTVWDFVWNGLIETL